MPLDLNLIRVGAPTGGVHEEPVVEALGGPVAGGVVVPMPGRDGLNASQDVLPARDTYPEATVAARLNDLQDRKAENDGLDLVTWFENRLA